MDKYADISKNIDSFIHESEYHYSPVRVVGEIAKALLLLGNDEIKTLSKKMSPLTATGKDLKDWAQVWTNDYTLAPGEDDEDLRRRVLLAIKTPSTGGNNADYIRWAESVEGVKRAWVRFNDQSKKVELSYMPEEGKPRDGLKKAIENKIRPLRPIHADFKVINLGAAKVVIRIKDLVPDDITKKEVWNTLEEFLRMEAEPRDFEDAYAIRTLGTVYFSRLSEAISNVSREKNHEVFSIEVDGNPIKKKNIEVLGNKIAILEGVEVNGKYHSES